MKQELVESEKLTGPTEMIETPLTKKSIFPKGMKPFLKYFIFVFMIAGGYILGELLAKFSMCQGMMGFYCIIPQLFFIVIILTGGLLIVINLILDLIDLYKQSAHKHIWRYFVFLLLIITVIVIYMQLKNQY